MPATKKFLYFHRKLGKVFVKNGIRVILENIFKSD